MQFLTHHTEDLVWAGDPPFIDPPDTGAPLPARA